MAEEASDSKLQALIKLALDQCLENFERGLNSHGSPTFNAADAVGAYKEKFETAFKNALRAKPDRWHGSEGESGRITRMAFYLGAITAFHAHAAGKTTIDAKKHFLPALEYVQGRCNVGEDGEVGERPLIYCAWDTNVES